MKTYAPLACCPLLLALLCAMPLARAQDAIDRLDMKAHAALDANDYDTAIKLWTDELKLDPNNANAAYNRAMAYEAKSNTDMALADYSAAIKLDPSDPLARESRARLYETKANTAQKPYGPQDPGWQNAIDDYAEATRLRLAGIADPAAWLARSAADGSGAQRVARWSAAIALDPKNPLFWLNRGQAEAAVYDPEKAIADYTGAILLDPKMTDAFLLRADAHSKRKDGLAAAAEDYTAALAIKPDKPNKETRLHRADIYRRMHDYEKAVADYTELLRAEPNDAALYTFRAETYGGMKQWEKAIADYTEVLRIHPGDYQAYRSRGGAYYEISKFDNVIADMSAAIALLEKPAQGNTGDADMMANCYVLRGDSYAYKGIYDKALADFDAAMATTGFGTFDAMDAKAWLLATCPKNEFRDGKKALELATKSSGLWKDGYHLDTLAAAEAETGNFDEAIKVENNALKALQEQKADALQHKDDPDYQEGRYLEDAERQLKVFAARLPFYEQKKPFRGEKDP